ncbi:hypothetical protein CRE_25698 [Caenorhabditis remanei]|uniref:Rho-GAP domain-containing protein n=1 Tax=Caenorhabditis remanei TaxID=31234 RepID=E3ML59_CAERE|nr:hypothetical protein CRE_25698 [Caenorhabditis remanei]
MATPVPKPRTKFGGDSLSPNGSDQNQNRTPETSSTSSPQPSDHSKPSEDVVVLRRPTEAEDTPKRVPPEVPPRPPAKPPRAMANSAAVQNFGNVLGELRLNLGESKPPEIGLIVNNGVDKDPSKSMSPPQRHAPPPPRPPPPPGWKPEVTQPLIPDRVSSHSNRPLPALPLDVELTPVNSGPSTSSSSTYVNTNPQTVENPLYLSLDAYRTLSGITPSPSNPPTASPDCEDLREWLTEEEEAEVCSASRPEDLNSNIPAPPPSRPSIGSQSQNLEENPYTPCPRRSDYSSTEFVGTTLDPFDDSFYTNTPSRVSTSSKNQNLYVAAHFEKSNTSISENNYDNVVEVCATTPSPVPTSHTYVNVPPMYPHDVETSDSVCGGNDEGGGGKMKIDGSSIMFVGFVCLTSTKREKRLHCRLRNMQLSLHEDEESTEASHGPYDIKDIYLFRQIPSTYDGPSTSTSSLPATTSSASILIHVGEKRHVISFIPEDPPNLWMFFLSEAWLSLNYGLTAVLRDADEMAICGMTWIKHGATGEWKCCSAGINNMTLHYMLTDSRDRIYKRNSHETDTSFGSSTGDELVEVDLRKVMTMRDKIDKSEYCPHVKHKRGPFSMTLHGVTLYIDSRDDATTSHWYEAIDCLLKRPATRLENLRLTGDNIPVIVDKCIRFVSAYGMKSEGIYRRNGKVTEAKTILTKLTEDPVGFYPVQENDETVYAVADVLRQFFRKLDEPLFPSSVQAELFDLAVESHSEELYKRYAELIEHFPRVHHATLKKLVGHLKIMSEHAQENRASVENLAKVFAASLFLTDSMEKKVFSESYNHQINTMIHLITGYDTIFQISMEEELSRQMVNDAEKKSLNAKKPSPDFIVAIHVWEKENRPFNVKMSLAGEEVCREAIAKRGFDGPPDSPYAVFECLSDGHLIRRLPSSQKMSKCVLQWIDWNCKDGYLLFDHDKYRFDGSDMSCFTGKVKVAEPGSRTFKSYEVKIENGTSIGAYRNEKLWKTWPMDEIIWYVGTEPSRKPPNSFNTTMIRSTKDGYSNRFTGFCFSFKEENERSRWLTALSHFSKSNDSEPLVYI